MPFFTSQESLNEWARANADANRKELKRAKEEYENAIAGIGKDEWMAMNHIENEAAWEHHIEWRRDYVKSIERKIRKYERMIK